MLRASMIFFFTGLLAMAIGAHGFGGISLETGRFALFVLLSLSIVSFLAALVTGNGIKAPVFTVPAMLIAAYGVTAALPQGAFAEETAGEKVENTAGDMKTDTQKAARKAKRKVKKATGHDSVTDDAKDGMKDLGDDVSNTAGKVKRKAD